MASPSTIDWNTLWPSALAEWEMVATPAQYQLCFKFMSVLDSQVDGDQISILVGVPSPFWQREIRKRYHEQIKETLKRLTHLTVEVDYKVALTNATNDQVSDRPLFSQSQPETPDTIGESSFTSELKRLRLEPERNLDNYAVSSSNEMAYAAAKAVAQRPGAAYNPLFLYGGVGVGKTHLMQAIGQFVFKQDMSTRIIYCTGEEFTNSIIEAIRKKSTASFRSKYRSVKLLLIDDIQFIAGKNTVQEEFFHTFNAITTMGGQIVMTSDKPPKEIDSLEDRLRSRFEGGLTIDIGEPNFELRCAILMIKANQLKLDLNTEIIQFIATYEEDTRALVGRLITLITLATSRKIEPTLDLAKEILRTEAAQLPMNTPPTPEKVVNYVAEYYKQVPQAVLGPGRIKNLTLPRHISMYLLKEYLQMNLVEIGTMFSNRDHTSVIHAVRKVNKLLNNDPTIHQDLTKIRADLYL